MLSLNSWARINTCSVTCQPPSSELTNIDLVITNADFAARNVSPANYSLKYNIMPYVGVLTYGEAARTSEAITFPPTQSRL